MQQIKSLISGSIDLPTYYHHYYLGGGYCGKLFLQELALPKSFQTLLLSNNNFDPFKNEQLPKNVKLDSNIDIQNLE